MLHQTSPSIFIKGFNAHVPEADIKRALRSGLSHCGEIVDIRLTLTPNLKKGFGVVYFTNAKAVEAAIRISGSHLAGGTLLISQNQGWLDRSLGMHNDGPSSNTPRHQHNPPQGKQHSTKAGRSKNVEATQGPSKRQKGNAKGGKALGGRGPAKGNPPSGKRRR